MPFDVLFADEVYTLFFLVWLFHLFLLVLCLQQHLVLPRHLVVELLDVVVLGLLLLLRFLQVALQTLDVLPQVVALVLQLLLLRCGKNKTGASVGVSTHQARCTSDV